MNASEETGFQPATGDGPPEYGREDKRAAVVRTAFEGLLQIRRLANTGAAEPERVPAPWELHRMARAVALAVLFWLTPIVYELANRFRLEKIDPTAPKSRVKKPIVFYIDRSAPEPIRTALLEGGQR